MSAPPLSLLRIQASHPHLSRVETWYAESFPPNERRDFGQLTSLLGLADMHLCVVLSGEQPVGFVSYWDLPDITFVEHLAIDPNRRGSGFGQQTMAILLNSTQKPVVLEVELPTDALSKSRVRFYERLGISVSPFPYVQPPYRPAELPIPMHLMTWPSIIDEAQLQRVAEQIRVNVYEKFW